VHAAANAGTLRLGTIDSWLAYQMSGGMAHITDASNAARTMLYDIHTGAWSDELTRLFGVDTAWLPTVTDSSGQLAQCDPDAFLGISAPIAGIAGDQQSALFGQACIEPEPGKGDVRHRGIRAGQLGLERTRDRIVDQHRRVAARRRAHVHVGRVSLHRGRQRAVAA